MLKRVTLWVVVTSLKPSRRVGENNGLRTLRKIPPNPSYPKRTPLELELTTPPTVYYPGLSVRQSAATEFTDENVLDWVLFLNHLGKRNYGLGTARSLGSVGVTLIKAKEMGRMLEDKWPYKQNSPEKSRKLQREVAKRLNGFMYSATSKAVGAKVKQLRRDTANEPSSPVDIINCTAFEFHDDLLLPEDLDLYDEDTDLDLDQFEAAIPGEELSQQLRQVRFGRAVYKIHAAGLQPYGKNRPLGDKGWGLNLNLNESLYDQRRALVRYLGNRGGEGLNTGLMDAAWEPHIVVFNLMQHLTTDTSPVTYDPDQVFLPEQMTFEEPRAVISP